MEEDFTVLIGLKTVQQDQPVSVDTNVLALRYPNTGMDQEWTFRPHESVLDSSPMFRGSNSRSNGFSIN